MGTTVADPLQTIEDFRGARDSSDAAGVQRDLERRARRFRDRMLAGPQVLFYRSFKLVRVPYPSRYGFWRAGKVKTPLVHIVNRLFVIQFRGHDGAVKTLLASPSDVELNKETPFFKDLAAKARFLGETGERLLAPTYDTVLTALAKTGLRPEDVDYLSYDHLHTQDLRRWLGGLGAPPVFPNAKLLVMRDEWESVFGLLPFQSAWYPPGGCDGIDPERVILLDASTSLGEGMALIRTPGHTPGNHSFVAHTPEGLLVTSENGICPDNYAPHASRIPGLREAHRKRGMQVILNGNTLDTGTIAQYLSMCQERAIAGPSKRNPEFYNVVTSSELASYWAFPGVRPTFAFGDLSFGAPRLKTP